MIHELWAQISKFCETDNTGAKFLTCLPVTGIDNGNDLERTLLEAIYEGVRKEPIISGRDHLDFLESIDKSIVGKKLSLMDPWRMLMMVRALYTITLYDL